MCLHLNDSYSTYAFPLKPAFNLPSVVGTYVELCNIIFQFPHSSAASTLATPIK